MSASEKAKALIGEDGQGTMSDEQIVVIGMERMNELTGALQKLGPVPSVVDIFALLAMAEFHRLELERNYPGVSHMFGPIIASAMGTAKAAHAAVVGAGGHVQ